MAIQTLTVSVTWASLDVLSQGPSIRASKNQLDNAQAENRGMNYASTEQVLGQVLGQC